MTTLIEAALVVAQSYPVFPTVNKKPSWSNAELGVKRGEGGYKIASRDPDRVRELFSHPRAKEIAVPMGELSGLVCIDVDIYKDPSLDTWARETLPITRMHRTRSGGLHFIYKHPGNGIRFPSTLRPGVDIKAGGTGYICWPGTDGYDAVNKRAVRSFPVDVLEQALKDKGGTGRMTAGSYNESSDGDLIELIQSGEDFYASLRTLSWRMADRGFNAEKITSTLQAVMDSSEASSIDHARYDDWAERYEKIFDLADSAVEKSGPIKLTPSEVAVLTEGEPFVDVRPIGPQRETTISDIEKRVAELAARPSSAYEERSISSLVTTKIRPIEWIVPRVIPTGGTVSLGGASSVGKTRWLASLVLALAVGDSGRLGLPKSKSSTSSLWVANEERTEDIWRRIKAVALQHGDERAEGRIVVRGKDSGMFRLVAINEIGQPEIDEANVAEVVQEALRRGVKLIVFDPYVTLSDGLDENSAAGAAALTKAFILVATLTGAAVLHAHHTPKDRSKDGDWYRGDASAWRGSGAIYSGLDVGLTLAPWMPRNKTQRIAWKSQALSLKLSRWIVLDTGKLREGETLDPVVYEMTGQEMQQGEGDPIGDSRLADPAQAENCLLDSVIDTLHVQQLAELLYGTLGYGEHSSPHQQLKGHQLWPASGDRMQPEHQEKLLSMFEYPVAFPDGTCQYVDTGRKSNARYRWIIREGD